MFQALSTRKYQCGPQELPNCSSPQLTCRPPELSCPWSPPSKVWGNYFCEAVHQPLEMGRSTLPPELYRTRIQNFPSASGHQGPCCQQGGPCSEIRKQNCFNPMSHTVSWFHRHTHPLGVPVWGLYLTWVLLWLKDVWTFTILHCHDLVRSPVPLFPSLFRGHDWPKAELGSNPDFLLSVHVSLHATKFGQDWVLLLPLTAYHFLFLFIHCPWKMDKGS